MVVTALPTMNQEEGRILLVGNETDILHSAFSFPLNEGGKRYPSADHYAHAQILIQLGLDEVHILELLATSNMNVSRKARELLQANMPHGHDMNSLAQYLITSRQSYTMLGLRLRAEQDKRFRQTLMETGDALLIVCDRRDPELGVGMDDEQFVSFARQKHANAERISIWMHDEKQRPRELGQNQLGFFLMWLRYELREKEKARWLSTVEIQSEGISMDQDDQPMGISISDFVLALQGPFQPLSNYFAFPFELKGEAYRSVEHYAYQRLFEALKLPFDEVMRLRTTVKPVGVIKCVRSIFARLKIDTSDIEHKMARLDRWRQSAMKHKITKNDYLQKLLLSTGHAILLETTTEGDKNWVTGTDEFEIQHLLTKKYFSPQLLIKWMSGREKVPPSLIHLGGNKTGLLLMELRAKLSAGETHRMPLISPLTSGTVLRSSLSNNMICFSPESVLHHFYPAPIRHPNYTFPGEDAFPSAAHLVAQMAIKFLDVNQGNAEWIMEAREGPECWERLHSVICESMQLPLDKIQQWYMEERQKYLKEAMKLQFEQHTALMHVLLDTHDALLVCCSRFSAVEAELNIGMRERDLRLWLSHVRQDTKLLMDLCLRPMAFRPPFFGGNRLGLLLMELRREFILAGVFPQQLPELALTVDTILGSESPMENYVATATFDVLNPLNFAAIWANPYLLMMKYQQTEGNSTGATNNVSNEVLQQNWTNALSKKQPPLLILQDDTLIEGIFSQIFIGEADAGRALENGDGPLEKENNSEFCSLDTLTPEILRSLYLKMSSQFRVKLSEMDDLQQQISTRSRDSSRLQELRRSLERTREQLDSAENSGQNGGTSTESTSAGSMQSLPSAQWTQAAAVSSSHSSSHLATSNCHPPPQGIRREYGPPGTGPPMQMHQIPPSRPPHHPAFPVLQHRGDGSSVAGSRGPPGKIPSLLAKELIEPSSSSMSPASSARSNLRPQSPQLKRNYSQHPYPSDQRRGGRWERGSATGARRGRRGGGPSGSTCPGRSQSPQYGRGGGGGVRITVSPLRLSSVGSGERLPSKAPSEQKIKNQHGAISTQKSSTNISEAQKSESVLQAPLKKKPKRMIDEAELSEGEILSDDSE